MIRRHKGFSLLEILVAFSIMAVALTIVLRIFGSGVNSAIVSEEYSIAVQIAESIMARTGIETPLQIGETTGSENNHKYNWSVAIRPVARTKANNDQAQSNVAGLQLLAVKVQVVWGEDGQGRSIELNSLRTMPVEEP